MIVKHLQLEKSLFVPGLPQFKQTLTQQHYPGIEMETHPLGVLCRWKGISFIVTKFDAAVVEEPLNVKKATKAA